MRSMSWAGDGKGLYLTNTRQPGMEVWYTDLLGRAHMLWVTNNVGRAEGALPSPDGRYLAIQTWETSGNMRMMENF